MTKKFDAAIKKVQARLRKDVKVGVQQAAMILQAEAQKRCPVDTGALRASAFTRPNNEENPDVIEYRVGFTQSYGIYVHEMPGPFKVGGPKFLEEPARELGKQLGLTVTKQVKP